MGQSLILIVDDHAVIRDLLVAALSLHGYRVAQAADGQEALVWLQQHAGQIDAILLDLDMPGMDGSTFLAQARSLALPAIAVMTATNAPLSLPYPILRKPFQIKDILSVLHQLLSDIGKASGKVESQ